MIISEKQVLHLMTVLYDSIKMNISIPDMFGLSEVHRVELYNDIMRQQPDELKEVKNLESDN